MIEVRILVPSWERGMARKGQKGTMCMLETFCTPLDYAYMSLYVLKNSQAVCLRFVYLLCVCCTIMKSNFLRM